MDKQSWVCTLLIQVSLCFALFFAFNIGGPQSSIYHSTKGRGGSVYLYFLSVRGGSRPLNQQTHLLKQMEKVAKIYRAEFVVNISELGEDDPLMQNGTLHFPALKIPWYTTGSSQGQKREYFLKQIRIPHGQFLDIIGVDTGLLLDDLHTKQSNGSGSNQLHWLTTILGLTDSNWRIVIGFHPMAVCEEYEKMETVHAYEPLHHMFLKFGVNAYLSKQGCDDHYTHEGSIAYIRHPDPTDGETYKAPSVNGSSAFTKYMHNGFFLHRISPLEIVSYFINSASEVVFKSTLHQRGKEAM